MSEHQTHSHEHNSEQQGVSAEHTARQQELLEKAKKEAELSKNKSQEKIDEIRNEIAENAPTSEQMSRVDTKQDEEPEAANTYWNSHEYRELAFKQSLSKIRKQLSGPERAGSKLFHQPIVERVSEVGSKTIARPSGVLVGSIFSFVISMGTYFFAKQNSYDMSYSVFISSFIGGFILGVVVEFCYRGIRSLVARD